MSLSNVLACPPHTCVPKRFGVQAQTTCFGRRVNVASFMISKSNSWHDFKGTVSSYISLLYNNRESFRVQIVNELMPVYVPMRNLVFVSGFGKLKPIKCFRFRRTIT